MKFHNYSTIAVREYLSNTNPSLIHPQTIEQPDHARKLLSRGFLDSYKRYGPKLTLKVSLTINKRMFHELFIYYLTTYADNTDNKIAS